jgi:hypothetical protein
MALIFLESCTIANYYLWKSEITFFQSTIFLNLTLFLGTTFKKKTHFQNKNAIKNFIYYVVMMQHQSHLLSR